MTVVDSGKCDHLEKDVLVNNVLMRAFIDGKSQRSLIRRSAAQQVERAEQCETIQLRGFGGSNVPCLPNISPTVKLDGTIFRPEVHIVNNIDLPSDVLLKYGRRLLCRTHGTYRAEVTSRCRGNYCKIPKVHLKISVEYGNLQ